MLTLREISVRIEYLPDKARITKLENGGRERIGMVPNLLIDLNEVLAHGRPHPLRPKPEVKPEPQRMHVAAPQVETSRRQTAREQMIAETKQRMSQD